MIKNKELKAKTISAVKFHTNNNTIIHPLILGDKRSIITDIIKNIVSEDMKNFSALFLATIRYTRIKDKGTNSIISTS